MAASTMASSSVLGGKSQPDVLPTLSPNARHIRAQLFGVAKEVVFFAAIITVSLSLLAAPRDEGARERALACAERTRINGSDVTPCPWPSLLEAASSRMEAVRLTVAADPVEAGCACFSNYFFISMCGNSPVAWVAAISFAAVDNPTFDAFRALGEMC